MARAGLAVVIALVLALATALGWLVYTAPGDVFEDSTLPEIGSVSSQGEPALITIEQGQSAEDIGAALEATGVIRDGGLFEVLVGLAGLSGSLEAGEYEFEPGTPVMEAVNRIAGGRTASRQVIFPEGLRSEEIGEILEANGITTQAEFLAAAQEGGYTEPFLADIGPGGLDGFLFPAGYEFKRNTPASDVVAAMLHGFQTNVADEIQLEGRPLTWREVIALAAIVQREAVVEEERPIIAAVFLNRLRVGLPLQADPTVQFAITEDPASIEQFGWWKEELTVDDLAFDSPYNTYVYAGLTPGPIANPGAASIAAVIRPADTEYLFFVARGDGSGEHVFANTLEEHLINVEQYRQRTGQ